MSDKPQTTRTRIMGVLTRGDTQIVFTDTPGFHKPKNKLGEKMVKDIGESISGVDACLLVLDAEDSLRESERNLIEKFSRYHLSAIAAINKIDLVKKKDLLLSKIGEISELYKFNAILPVSAKTGDGFDDLIKELEALAQPSNHFFEEDTLTDQTERVLAAEFIREKMLMFLDKEVPHGIGIEIEKMRERENSDILDIEAVIYCEKESHKGIVIGKKGAMLKKIAAQARKDLEDFFCCKINLQTWVKVKENWRNKEGYFKNFGLK